MTISRRRAFYNWETYPELAAPKQHWQQIRQEALQVMGALGHHLANASASPPSPESAGASDAGSSYILPLVPEPEDRGVLPDEICAQARALAPKTTALVGAIPYVRAYAYSRLTPVKHIPEHEHWNPFLVAILCLQGGDHSYIVVNGERCTFHDGEYVVFDYTLPHYSKNEGSDDRIVLLMIIDPALVRKRP